jgi:hypothetical protein
MAGRQAARARGRKDGRTCSLTTAQGRLAYLLRCRCQIRLTIGILRSSAAHPRHKDVEFRASAPRRCYILMVCILYRALPRVEPVWPRLGEPHFTSENTHLEYDGTGQHYQWAYTDGVCPSNQKLGVAFVI